MFNNNHGRVFAISSADQIEMEHIVPNRSELLDANMIANTNQIISEKKELLFLGNDVSQSISKNRYELILHGITPCGSKTTIIVNGIYPYIDVDTQTRPYSNSDFIIKIETKLNSMDIDFKKIEIVKGKNFMKYHEETREYIRVYFNTLKSRMDCINMFREAKITTYSNDCSTYYRVVARTYNLNLSGWNKITKYQQVWTRQYKSQFIFNIDINDIERFDIDENNESYGYNMNSFKYENMIIAGFDIEMIPFRPNAFPDAERCSKDSIFMICITFHYDKKPEALVSVNLTLKENDPLEDAITIVCANEGCLLLAFSKLFDLIQPDFITEFNGGGFDWRNIIVKAQHFGIIPDFLRNMAINVMERWEANPSMLNRYYQEKSIKIGGAHAPFINKSLKMQGYVNFDTLCIFKQLELKADSHKLNECLKRCNLGSKDEMDIQEMFEIYRSGTATQMKLVAHYCYIDTFKLQALLLKKNVIQDRREISILSMTSIYDAFCYANGSKIRNILMSVGEKLGYKFDTLYRPAPKDPDAKFPGAFVVPPKKGIVRPMLTYEEYLKENNLPITESIINQGYNYIENNYDSIMDRELDATTAPEELQSYIQYTTTTENQYPVSGLDFSSLYPSLIMAYNISPETLITNKAYADKMIAKGHKLHYITFIFQNVKIEAWYIQHENKESLYGLCPEILIKLFAKRAALKKILKPYNESKLNMEMEMKDYPEGEYPHIEKYNEVCFDFEYYDAKQKALKVFMNTFYGELGNFLSFICAVETAAGVTTMGKYNLMLVKSFIEDDLGMKIYYGDSDSLYVACNKKHFNTCDKLYFTGKLPKLEYCTGLVHKTFELIEITKNEVNNHLYKDNGTKFLKMAYEEVLYPVVFVSKKKYFGIAHEEKVNFYPKHPFIRGLDIIKRGKSDVLKNVSLQVVNEILDINTTCDMLTLVAKATENYFNTQWDVNNFIKTAVYKPTVQNPSVINLINRYRAINYPQIPEPNVRFKYIVCKKYLWTYDTQGRQSELSVGDRWELLEKVIAENIPIDLEYYFNNEITGQMARFIAYHDQFDVCDREALKDTLTDKEQYEKIELAMFNSAKKYIIAGAKIYADTFINKGGLFKQTYKIIANIIRPKNARTKKFDSLYPSEVNKVVHIFEYKLEEPVDEYSLEFVRNQLETYINDKYKISTTLTNLEVKSIYNYIQTNDLFRYLTDCSDEWISNIVAYVRKEFNYDAICKNTKSVETPYDLFTKEQINEICNREDLYFGLPKSHAIEILKLIDQIIIKYT